MEKLWAGIAFDGESAEHEVSLQLAKNIVDVIDKSRFDVVLLGIDRQGQWHVSDASNYLLNADGPTHTTLRPSTTNLAQVSGKHEHQLIDARNGQSLPTVDIILPIVRGTLGKDGSLQGMLRVTDLPFVGSDVLTSTACMDKDVTKRLLRDAGLNIAPFIALTRTNRHNINSVEVESKLRLPLSVKPANQGSFTGVGKVTGEGQYAIAVDLAFEFDHKVAVEQGVKGREIECAVLGSNNPQASTCGEIVLTSGFYTYDTRYINEDGAEVVAPTAIAPEINDRVRTVAVQICQTLGCVDMARADVFLTPESEVVINEADTLPGLANISMCPRLWQTSDLSYIDLTARLIKPALERHAADNALRATM